MHFSIHRCSNSFHAGVWINLPAAVLLWWRLIDVFICGRSVIICFLGTAASSFSAPFAADACFYTASTAPSTVAAFAIVVASHE